MSSVLLETCTGFPVFKLSPCCSNDKLSSGYFPGVWVLKADVSEHCVGSIFNRWWSVSDFTTCWRWNRHRVPKRRLLILRRRGITQKTIYHVQDLFFFSYGAATQHGSWPPHSWGFLDHTQRRTTVVRTHLDEWSARRRDLYLITHNTHNRQTSMPRVEFQRTISAGERPQTYALDRAATGSGVEDFNKCQKGKVIPLQAWTGPEVSRRLRLPDFKTVGIWRW